MTLNRPAKNTGSYGANALAPPPEYRCEQDLLVTNEPPVFADPKVLSQSDCRYGPGEGRSHDLKDEIAAMFQLIFHRCGLHLIADDGHAGFVGPSRMPV
jgi:hypothetical protein